LAFQPATHRRIAVSIQRVASIKVSPARDN
jgi:hypothetical protein